MAGAAALAAAVATTGMVPAVVAAASGGDVVSSTFEGSSSFMLSNGTVELTFLPQGASMASVVLIDDSEKMNPLWNPVRMNREQGRAAKPSSMTGHMICVDGFGRHPLMNARQGSRSTARHSLRNSTCNQARAGRPQK
jgi:hypothetical protein